MLALKKKYYKLYKKTVSHFKLKRHLTKLKRTKYTWWNEINSQTLQDICERIDKGYSLFFSLRKKGNKKIGLPKFKNKHKYKSLTYTQSGWNFDGEHTIEVQGRSFKFHKSREITNVKRIVLKKDAVGDWWVCFFCNVENELQNKVMTGETAGFDFGLKTFLTDNKGKRIQSPLFYANGHKQTKKLQRLLSKKQKGSNNRHKARKNLARHHRKISHQRTDHHTKLSLSLVRKYDVLCFEDLNIRGMKALWGKKISDLAFYSFMLILQNMAKKHGKKVVKIDRFYPSTKTCHVCGEIKEDLRLKDRMWNCNGCKMLHDRDHNAAINIHQVGTSTVGVGDVRPTLVVGNCC
jgi:putative transposase